MRAGFFTEAGTSIGLGHAMRCVGLAQGFVEKGWETELFIAGDATGIPQAEGCRIQYCQWTDIEVRDLLGKRVDVAVVDSYLAPRGKYLEIRAAADRCIYFDDTNRMEYPGGYVVNGAIAAERMGYGSDARNVFLLGPRYQPLRKAFWDVPDYRVSPTVGTYLITFGGSDVANMTPQILRRLSAAFPERRKNVVVGRGFSNMDDVKSSRDRHTELFVDPDDYLLLKLMRDSDLAISAAGHTLNELARVGIPTVGIQVAGNQEANIRGWEMQGFLLGSSELSPTFLRRTSSSENGRRAIDGQGARRMVRLVTTDGPDTLQ